MAQGNGQAVLITGDFRSVVPDIDEPVAGDWLDLRNFEKLPTREVPVSGLSSGVYLRQGGTNAAHVQLLLDVADLPPILVQEDGWRVIDGAHRLAAAKLRGDGVIAARFLDCTDSEALVLGMKANASHGLPLSKADRVSGAKRVVTDHPDWSDRAIADITGLSAKTIASLRTRSADGAQIDGKRLGRDGRRRPVSAGEGRLRAAEYLSAHPDAPLRQVAREADVSLGTVHDVSARLRRGVSPERNGHRAPAAGQPVRPPVGAAPALRVAPSVPAVAPAAEPVPPGANTARPGASTSLPGANTAPSGASTALTRAGTAPPGVGTATPTASPTPLRRRNHTDAPLTWSGIAAKVAGDPAIRYTDGGKEFLRWMALHAIDPGEWREFADSVPAHWGSVIAPIAETIGREWSQFAERLKSRQEGMSRC
jgi:ParB-like nuclease family protein